MTMDGFREFQVGICNNGGRRNYKITNSFGVRDVYRTLRHEGWKGIGKPLSEHEFYSIVRKMNDLLAVEIANGRTVRFPYRMGKLELVKKPLVCKVRNGKIKSGHPVLWHDTLKLWYGDPDARKRKLLVRTTAEWLYLIEYKKFSANYHNKKYYGFQVNRSIRTAMQRKVRDGELDTLWQKYLR